MDNGKLLQSLFCQSGEERALNAILFELHAINTTLLEIELRMSKDPNLTDSILDKILLEMDWMKKECGVDSKEEPRE